MSSPSASHDRVIGGRYRVVRVIGEGGMGTVLQAWDTVLRRDVALKMLHGAYVRDTEFVERFAQEAQAIARVRHPGVIQVYDFQAAAGDDPAFLVMEYVDGDPLSDVLSRERAMSWPRAARLGAAVCDALAAAHAAGVVHRDIKPSNILIQPDGVVRVADFGIARVSGGAQTRTGIRMGTPPYMAPEVCRGRRATAAADIYGLTAVLYECVCGRPPFLSEDSDSSAVLIMHITLPVPDPRGFAPDLGDAGRAVLLRGLEKEPDHRFAGAAQLAAALRSTLAPDPGRRPDAPTAPEVHLPPAADPDRTVAVTRPTVSADAATRPRPPRRAAPPAPEGAPVAPPRSGRTVAAAAVAVLALAGGGAGVLAGRGGGEKAAATVTARATALPAGTARIPTDWNAGAARPETASLGLTGARTYLASPAAGEAGVTIGTSRATGLAMLDRRFISSLAAPLPAAKAITATTGGRSLHYDALTPRAHPDRRIGVHLTPTTRGVVTVVCFAPAERYADHAPACARIAASLRVAGTAFPLAPDPAYGARLDRAVRTLDARRATALGALAAATSRAGQASASRAAATAYANAAAALANDAVSPQVADRHAALRAAMLRARDAYGGLGQAADAGDAAAWTRARTSARSTDAAVGASVKAFVAAGYALRGS